MHIFIGVSAFSIANERGMKDVLGSIEIYQQRRELIETQNEHLLSAAISGSYDDIRRALGDGAEVNVANMKGYTPLIAASRGSAQTHTHTRTHILNLY